LAYGFLGILHLVGPMLQLSWTVYSGHKLACLYTNLAWYWISASEEIREATDKIFSNVWDIILNVVQS
jgi:hypothetical protein